MKAKKTIKRTIKKETTQIPVCVRSPEELKSYIAECEEIYKQSFKGDSCKVIMDAYRNLQAAKKEYYRSIGKTMPKQEVEDDEIICE